MSSGLCGSYIDYQESKDFTERYFLEKQKQSNNIIKNIKPLGLQNSLALNANGFKAFYVIYGQSTNVDCMGACEES